MYRGLKAKTTKWSRRRWFKKLKRKWRQMDKLVQKRLAIHAQREYMQKQRMACGWTGPGDIYQNGVLLGRIIDGKIIDTRETMT